MTDREKIHVYRVLPIIAIINCTLLYSLALFWLNQLYLDELICMLFLDAAFLLLVIYELSCERRHKQLAQNKATTYARVAIGYGFCSLCIVGFYFLPEYCRFFMIIPIVMYVMSNEIISMICSSFFLCIFALTCGCNLYEIIGLCLMMIFGVILAKGYYDTAHKIWIILLTAFSNILITSVFSYLEGGEFGVFSLAQAGIVALVSVIALVMSPAVKKDTEAELQHRLKDIMSTDYSEYKELKDFYPADYKHAIKVSEISYRCALAIGLDEELCKAAGFYYRIGKWAGEPHVTNGVLRATRLCFPVELVAIIFEYYGEEQLPSTPESALIHMVDALAIKMDAIVGGVGLSNWNTEMIIYQTLNEYSNSGLYDRCGISMNQFLKIREILVKESWIK